MERTREISEIQHNVSKIVSTICMKTEENETNNTHPASLHHSKIQNSVPLLPTTHAALTLITAHAAPNTGQTHFCRPTEPNNEN